MLGAGTIVAAAGALFGSKAAKPPLVSAAMPPPTPGRSSAIVATAGRMLHELLTEWVSETWTQASQDKPLAFRPEIKVELLEDRYTSRDQLRLLARMDVRLRLNGGGVITPKNCNQFDLLHLRDPELPIPFDHIEREMKKALIGAMPQFRAAYDEHTKTGTMKVRVDDLYGYAPLVPSLMPPMRAPMPTKAEYEKMVLEMAEMKKKMTLDKWAFDVASKEAGERAALVSSPPNLAWDPAKDGKL